MKNLFPPLFLVLLGLFLIQGCAHQVTPSPNVHRDARQDARPDATTKPAPSATQARPDKPAKPQPTKKPVQAQAARPKQIEPSVPDLNSDVLYHLLAGELSGQRGKLAESAAHYMEALRLSPDVKVAERAARIAVFARQDRLALEAAQIWVRLQPDSLEAQQVTAALLVRTGQTQAAMAHFEIILRQTANSEQKGFMLIVSLLSKEQDKQAAMAVMDKLVANRQDNPTALFAYSSLSLLIGDISKAEQSIQKALSLRPDWTEAHLLYANILIRQERHEDAVAALKSTLKRYPDNSKLRLFYARKLVDEKQYEDAHAQFSRILEDDSENVDALYALGLLGLQVKQLERAQESFTHLIELGKRVDESYYYLGEIRERQNQPQEAIDYYQQVDKEPYYIEAQIRIAVLLAAEGELEQARDQLHRVRANTLEVELRLYLAEGELLRDASRYEDAFEHYTDALEQMPGNSRLLYARALIAEKFERLDIAIQDLELILKSAPDNAEALNALGYTLVDRTERLQEGLKYIERALALKPEDPAIMDSMGWACYRLGQHDKALDYLRRAHTKMQDSEIASHLGEVLWVTGDHDAARKVWDDALQQTPQHELLLDVIQRFTE